MAVKIWNSYLQYLFISIHQLSVSCIHEMKRKLINFPIWLLTTNKR